MNISEWTKGIVENFNLYEDREIVIFKNKRQREIALAEFVIRALGNCKCEGSADVVEALAKRHLNQD